MATAQLTRALTRDFHTRGYLRGRLLSLLAVSGSVSTRTMAVRKELTLAKRVQVIEYAQNNPGVGSRSIAERFRCGRTQIQKILSQKETILMDYAAMNVQSSRKRCRVPTHADVNDAMYEWYSLARERNIPVTGPMLQEEALQVASRLGNTTFKASNGWLEAFKKRHNIKQLVVSGESADVSDVAIEAWLERLPSILRGYSADDIWNQDETGCFYRALPEKSLAEKKKQCHGGKKAKQRLTISFFVNAAGEKEVPVVIGKAAKPRCFKGLNDTTKPLGIPYYSNPKSWMTSEIMEDIVGKFNRKMQRKGRHALLLIDNAPSHSPTLREKFSNVKVVFLPKNTTSRLQPLDAGIIKNFKCHYRRCLIRHVLASIKKKN